LQVFLSVENVNYVNIREAISQGSRFILVLIVFYLVSSSMYLSGVFVILIATAIFMLIYSVMYTRKVLPELREKSPEVIDKKRINKFIFYSTIASISSVFFSYIDTIMLGFFVPPEYLGYYRAAFTLILGIAAVLSFPNALLLPIFTKIEKANAEKVLNKTIRYASIITLPSIFGLLALGKYFMVLLYGYSYVPGAPLLSVLSLLIIPIVFTGIWLSLFSAKEKPEIFAKLILIAAVINVILNGILIFFLLKISPLWGTVGAGIATVISWYFYFIFSYRFIKKEMGFKISFASLTKPIIASLIMFVAIRYSFKLITDMTPLLGIAEVIGGIIIYFAILLLIKGITKEDVLLVKHIF
jgi:stage V sporulation protein B